MAVDENKMCPWKTVRNIRHKRFFIRQRGLFLKRSGSKDDQRRQKLPALFLRQFFPADVLNLIGAQVRGVYVNEHCDVLIQGRIKRIYLTVFNGAPFKINPNRIEEALQKNPSLAECGVVCIPHGIYAHLDYQSKISSAEAMLSGLGMKT